MSYLEEPQHPGILALKAQGTIPQAVLIPLAAGLNPLIMMLEPHIDFDALWRVVNANAANGVGPTFAALEASASYIVTSPSFEAQLFSMGCKVAANLWTHGTEALIAPPPESEAIPLSGSSKLDPYGNVS